MKYKLTMVFTLFIFSIIPPVFANTQGLDYVALGDSLAAGQTPDHQFDKGYPDFIAQNLESSGALHSFTKRYAVSGYTSGDVLSDIKMDVKKGLPGDTDTLGIQRHIQQAELITLDLGANDILQEMDLYQLYLDPAKVPGLLYQIESNTSNTIKEIKRLNPTVRIYLMGYYNCLPHVLGKNHPLLGVLDQLNESLQHIAELNEIDYIPTQEILAVDKWLYFPNLFDIHPSLAGYEVIADEFWKVIHFDLLDLDHDRILTLIDLVGHVKNGEVVADILQEYGNRKE